MRVTNLSCPDPKSFRYPPRSIVFATLFGGRRLYFDPMLKNYNPTHHRSDRDADTCGEFLPSSDCSDSPDCPLVLRPQIYLRAVQMQIVPNVAQVSSNRPAPRGEDSR